MRSIGRAVTGCLSVIFLALCGIAILAFLAPMLLRETAPMAVGPEPSTEPSIEPSIEPTTRPTARPSARPANPPGVPPESEPDAYAPWVDARRAFTRTQEGGYWKLGYGFIDHHGQPVDITCRVAMADHERERAFFGYAKAAVQQELNARLAKRAAEELARRGLTDHVRLRFEGWGGYRWTSELAASGEELERLERERDDWNHWMKTVLSAEGDTLQASLLKERGFLLEANTISVDYASLAVRGSGPLADCAAALAAASVGASDRRTLGLFLAFMQELRYEVPPDLQDGKETEGVWVPTEVLVNAHGDCDSKAVAFCALWRGRAPRLLFISLPEHALVAVEGKPGPGEHFVRLGNRYYLLCEVAGPGKIHPGGHPVPGNYSYVAIPGLSD